MCRRGFHRCARGAANAQVQVLGGVGRGELRALHLPHLHVMPIHYGRKMGR